MDEEGNGWCGQEGGEPDLFIWGDKYVRPSDPLTSKKARGRVRIQEDEIECYWWWQETEREGWEDMTRKELRWWLMWEKGMSWTRAESLRRRITGLVELGILELVNGFDGKVMERDGSEVLRLSGVGIFGGHGTNGNGNGS